MLAALITLKQQGFVPERDIILALTADEEAGDVANGAAWLLKEHRALVDAALVIKLDAGEAGMKNGKRLYVGAQTSEKVYMTFMLEASDKGGHSSRPTAANPIYRLARGLDRLSAFRFPVHLTGTTTGYFRRRALLESGTVRADMLAVVQPKPAKAALARLSANVETNILLRTTCTATMIEGGHAQNALPQRARATIQCRAIPGESPEAVQRALAGAHRRSLAETHRPAGRHAQPGDGAHAGADGPGRSRRPDDLAWRGSAAADVGRRLRQHLHTLGGHTDAGRGRHVRRPG